MRNGYYRLEGKVAVKCFDVLEWGKSCESSNRTVAKTTVGGADVSTVFLGLDHSFGSGPPLLFETMVFGGPFDQEQKRYTTWEQAEKGHNKMVQKVKDGALKTVEGAAQPLTATGAPFVKEDTQP